MKVNLATLIGDLPNTPKECDCDCCNSFERYLEKHKGGYTPGLVLLGRWLDKEELRKLRKKNEK